MKLTKTSLAIAALFFCLGSSTTFAADAATMPAEPTVIVDEATPEVLDTTETTEEVDTANPEMDLAELQAEIRIACEEFAIDEKVAEEKVPEFVDACVAENMPAEETDTIETVDNGVPAVEEAVPADAAVPVVTGQTATQE